MISWPSLSTFLQFSYFPMFSMFSQIPNVSKVYLPSFIGFTSSHIFHGFHSSVVQKQGNSYEKWHQQNVKIIGDCSKQIFISEKKWRMMEFWQEERWWLLTMENGGKMLQVFFFLSTTSNAFGKSMSKWWSRWKDISYIFNHVLGSQI